MNYSSIALSKTVQQIVIDVSLTFFYYFFIENAHRRNFQIVRKPKSSSTQINLFSLFRFSIEMRIFFFLNQFCRSFLIISCTKRRRNAMCIKFNLFCSFKIADVSLFASSTHMYMARAKRNNNKRTKKYISILWFSHSPWFTV